MKLLALLILALVVGHILTLSQVFDALDYADGAAKRAYTDIHPQLERLDRRIKREYREAQELRGAQRRGVSQ